MTKAVTSVVIIILVLYGVFKTWEYWDKISNDKIADQKQAVASAIVPEQLAGLPREYETTLKTAEKRGAVGLREWLKAYSKIVEDPRKAWIELDYVVMVSREDPAEARRVFAAVKKRTAESSPVYPRIQTLEKTYQ